MSTAPNSAKAPRRRCARAGSRGTHNSRLSCNSFKFKIYARDVDECTRGGHACPDCRIPPHALVTGGGRGIGRAIASALVRAGATVTVLGRNRATLDEAVAAGDAHFADVADVADQAAVNAAIAEAAARPADRYIDRQCRRCGIRAVRKIRCGAVPAHDGCQFHGCGSCRPGRVALDEGPRPMAALSRSPRPPVSRAMPMSAPIARRSTR